MLRQRFLLSKAFYSRIYSVVAHDYKIEYSL